jgi:antitoxin (DNA-binding transcriptional repressor) of toxin-antitoxin stability system
MSTKPPPKTNGYKSFPASALRTACAKILDAVVADGGACITKNNKIFALIVPARAAADGSLLVPFSVVDKLSTENESKW